MRIFLALPLILGVAACDVTKDEANDQTTIEFNEQHIEDAANDVGNVASDAVSTVGNAAEAVGDKVSNEVGDVDVKVTRNSH
jgi:hypothetical protein